MQASVGLVMMRQLLQALQPRDYARKRRKVDELQRLELVELCVSRQVCAYSRNYYSATQLKAGLVQGASSVPARVRVSPARYAEVASVELR